MDNVPGTVEPRSGDGRRVPLRTRRWVLIVLAAIAVGITLGPLPVGLLDASHAVARELSSWWPVDTTRTPTRTETEALLNVIAPAILVLAVAAAWPDVRPSRLLAGAALASVFVETAQLALPGRNPLLRDIVLNVIGAFAATVTVVILRRFLRSRR